MQQRIAIVSKDRSFCSNARSALNVNDQFQITIIDKNVTELHLEILGKRVDGFVIDMDATKLVELEALQKITHQLGDTVPILVVLNRHSDAALRVLFHLRVSDFIAKPVTAPDLIRACLGMFRREAHTEKKGSRIVAFMPAASGNGATTLAIQAAFLFQSYRRTNSKTCLVDLNLNDGSCAEYLDLEPRFNPSEVANNPDRLDNHLLNAMLSSHKSGLSVLAAPVSPTDTLKIEPELVLRLLDTVSVCFDYVVIDMPKPWQSWTEAVLLGSDETYIVTETGIPALRRAQRLVQAVGEKSEVQRQPKVIVNRYERRAREGGVSAADIEQLFGDSFAGGVANNYKLVRDAVDRGVPLYEIDPEANVIEDLRKILFSPASQDAEIPSGLLATFGRHLFKQRA